MKRSVTKVDPTDLLAIGKVANRPLAFATPTETQESCDAWRMLQNAGYDPRLIGANAENQALTR